MIMHLTVSKLLALEVVQKGQRCQLCVLWENSTVPLYFQGRRKVLCFCQESNIKASENIMK